jgi:hypothetical protein
MAWRHPSGPCEQDTGWTVSSRILQFGTFYNGDESKIPIVFKVIVKGQGFGIIYKEKCGRQDKSLASGSYWSAWWVEDIFFFFDQRDE